MNDSKVIKLEADFIPSRNQHGIVPSARVTGPHCAVPTCRKNTKDGITLHNFPRNFAKREHWKKICLLEKATRYTQICSDHFEDDSFYIGREDVKTLKRGMTPTKFLPVSIIETAERSLEKNALSEDEDSAQLQASKEAIPVEVEESIENPSSCNEVEQNISERMSEESQCSSANLISHRIFMRAQGLPDDSAISSEFRTLNKTSRGTQTNQIILCDRETQTVITGDINDSEIVSGALKTPSRCSHCSWQPNLITLLRGGSNLLAFTDNCPVKAKIKAIYQRLLS